VTTDIELEAWRREWRGAVAALPDPRQRIRRQNLRKALALSALVVCLAVSTVGAVREPGSFWKGLATGLWVTTLLVGGYAWRAHRGAWRPAAQTTQAYAELCFRRAQAQDRTRRFAFGLLLIATSLYVAYLALSDGPIGTVPALVAGGLVLELLLFLFLRRRDRRNVEEARRLMEITRAASDEEIPSEGGSRS
jgi:Flp pilus assembly protein TadB